MVKTQKRPKRLLYLNVKLKLKHQNPVCSYALILICFNLFTKKELIFVIYVNQYILVIVFIVILSNNNIFTKYFTNYYNIIFEVCLYI